MEKQTLTKFFYDDDISSGEASLEIHLPFVAKTVTVSNVRYISNFLVADKELGIAFVKCDFIYSPGGVLCSFIDGTDNSTPVTFKCRPDLRNDVLLTYDEADGRDGELSFALTFSE